MDLSKRVVLVKSTLKPDEEEYPSFTSDDISLLFGDIASPTGFILNKGDPTGFILNKGDPWECYVVFPESGYIPEILKLVEDPQWVGIHRHLTLDRSRKGILSIVAKLIEGQTLEEEEELEYSPIESETEWAVGPQFSTPKKGDDPVIPELVKHFKSLQTTELKQIMAALNREMHARHVPQDSPSKPDGLGSHPQDVSSILHNLIMEGP